MPRLAERALRGQLLRFADQPWREPISNSLDECAEHESGGDLAGIMRDRPKSSSLASGCVKRHTEFSKILGELVTAKKLGPIFHVAEQRAEPSDQRVVGRKMEDA